MNSIITKKCPFCPSDGGVSVWRSSQFPRICCSCRDLNSCLFNSAEDGEREDNGVLQLGPAHTIVSQEHNGLVALWPVGLTYQTHHRLHYILHASLTGTNGARVWLSHFYNYGPFFLFFKKRKYDSSLAVSELSEVPCEANKMRLRLRCFVVCEETTLWLHWSSGTFFYWIK